MKHLLRNTALGLGGVVVLLTCGVVWLLGTPSGARTVLGAVSRFSPVVIEAEVVAGRLAEELRLEGISVRWSGGDARIERLLLRWFPAALLRGRLDIETLAFEGVEVLLRQENEREAPPRTGSPDLSFPRVGGRALDFEARLGSLKAGPIAVMRGEAEPFLIETIGLSMSWRGGVLSVKDLEVHALRGTLTGEATAGFVSPAVRLALTAEPAENAAGIDILSLNLALEPATAPRSLSGPFEIVSRGGEKELLRLDAAVEWTPRRIALEELRLLRPGTPGRAEGRVELAAARDWRFAVDLGLFDLDLAPETGVRTDLSGRLQAAGTPGGYEGRFSLFNAADGLLKGGLSSPFRGSAEEIALTDLQGEWLRGRLRGTLEASWKQGWAARGEIAAEGLDPAVITPGWPGRINLALRASGAGGEERPLYVAVEGKLRRSVLRGRRLTGEVDARLHGDDLRIASLALRGDGFDIAARGRLNERIDIRVDIPRLGGLVPGGQGRLKGDGWARWRDGQLGGVLNAAGEGIEVADLRMARLELAAERREGVGAFTVAAAAQGLAHGALRLDTVDFRAEGMTDEHHLRLALSGPDLALEGRARGWYGEGAWGGIVEELRTAGRRLGTWTLAEPAGVRFSPEQIVLSPFRLTAEGGAFLQAEADLALSHKSGTIQGRWEKVDLSPLNPWIDDLSVTGRSSGEVRARWLPGERFDLQGQASVAGTVIREGHPLEIRQGQARLAWGARGLQGSWEVDLASLGRASGAVSSPNPARPGLPPDGEGTALWDLADLGLLSPWIPGADLSGTSTGDLTLRWRRGHPLAFHGRAQMAGAVAGDRLRLDVREARATLNWDRSGLAGQWRIDLGEDGSASGVVSSPEAIRAALPQEGELRASWQEANLGLFSPWIPEASLEGRSSGEVKGRREADGRIDLYGSLALSARLEKGDLSLKIDRGEADLHWDASGLRGRWEIALAPEGRLTGEIASETDRFETPEKGRYHARWEGIDLAHLRPWLPPGLLLEGTLGGRLEGEWLPQERLRMAGEARVSGGEVQWAGEDGILTAPLRQAEVAWTWKDETLDGSAVLALAEYGRVEGNIQLPLIARFSPQIRETGPVRGALQADMREEGLLNAFLPGLVQDSSGQVSLDLTAAGTWAHPDLRGEVRLQGAGAYIPAAGVRLEDVELQAVLEGETIHLSSLRARSGPGFLEGAGTLRLRDWKPESYEATVRGEGFQAVRLPELELLVSPDLAVDGTFERLRVRGDILIPEMLVRGRKTPTPVQPSPDVVVVDAPERLERQSPLALDVRVRILLGKHVLLDVEGVDARLEGGLRLTVRGLSAEEITAQGDIRVAQGRYSAYGVNLNITRGNVHFAGGPVDRPTLDILALRTIGEVKAGVQVSGTPPNPEVRLYSEPTLSDTDILAYIVLGRPLEQGGGDTDLLLLAAGALLSQGESAVLQDRLQRRLGVDVLTVEGGDGDVTGARITIGKYLNPDLYISFGQSLFTNTQAVRMRYSLTRRIQLESTVGRESAVDLYYRIEFR